MSRITSFTICLLRYEKGYSPLFFIILLIIIIFRIIMRMDANANGVS